MFRGNDDDDAGDPLDPTFLVPLHSDLRRDCATAAEVTAQGRVKLDLVAMSSLTLVPYSEERADLHGHQSEKQICLPGTRSETPNAHLSAASGNGDE